MGCWNGTCMISNLPIISGEKVKLVILHDLFNHDRYSGGFCYANGLMRPLFLPIDGEYNDYGMIENIVENRNFHFVTEHLKKAYSQIEVEKEILNEFTLEDVLTGIERSSLRVKRNKDLFQPADKELTKGNLAFVMIRKDIWDAICDEYVGEFWNDDTEETANGQYYISAKEYCKRRIKANLDALAKLKEIEATGDDHAAAKFALIEMRYESIFMGPEDALVKYGFDYSELLENTENIAELTNAWTEMVIINSFLNATRKAWFVQQGAGAQNADWEVYKMLNKIVDEICDEKINEYE